MAHHRGLVITLVVVVVIAVVGIGVMGLTTNDTDESVQEELAPKQFGIGGPQPNQSSSIEIRISCRGSVGCRGKVIPLWDAWNKCVDDDYTRERDWSAHSPVVEGFSLAVTTKCFLQHSQMHWRITEGSGNFVDVELHEDAGDAFLHAECGAASGLSCGQIGRRPENWLSIGN